MMGTKRHYDVAKATMYSGQGSAVCKKTKCEWRMLGLLIVGCVIVIIGLTYVAVTRNKDGAEEEKKDGPAGAPPKNPLEVKMMRLQNSIEGSPKAWISSFENWDQTTKVPSAIVVSPTNEEEVQKVIRAAKKHRLKVRPMGSGHSYSNLFADEDQVILETKNLTTRSDGPPIELHRPMWGNKLQVVTAATGLFQEDLVKFFVANGVQIRATAHEMTARLGGVFSTGVRGETIRRGPISDIVLAVKLVDGQGDIRSFNVLQHPEEMAMLRLCVGLCGVILEISFRVEPLEVARVTDTFPSQMDVIFNTTALRELHDQGMVLMHWSPLSSLTPEEWEQYDNTSKIPQTYNPKEDVVWLRHTTLPITGVVPDSRFILNKKVQVVPETDFPGPTGTLEGPLKKNVANMTTAAPPVEATQTTNQESDEGNTTAAAPAFSLRYHQFALTYTKMFVPGEYYVYVPEGVVRVDTDDLDIIYSVMFDFPDDAEFSTTIKVLEMTFAGLAEYAYRGEMPVLTMMYKWIQKSPDCYLCPGNINHNSTEVDHIFSLELIGSPSLTPLYEQFVNEMSSEWHKAYPTSTLHWAKWYEFIKGLPQYMRTGFGESMDKFLQLRKDTGLDPDNMFTNDYLYGIFYPK